VYKQQDNVHTYVQDSQIQPKKDEEITEPNTWQSKWKKEKKQSNYKEGPASKKKILAHNTTL